MNCWVTLIWKYSKSNEKFVKLHSVEFVYQQDEPTQNKVTQIQAASLQISRSWTLTLIQWIICLFKLLLNCNWIDP